MPSDAENEQLERAVQLHQRGDLQQAGHYYTQVLQANPRHHVALGMMGLIFHQLSKPEQAISLLQRAVAAEPGYAEGYYHLGNAYRAAGMLPQALEALKQALCLRPNYPEAFDAIIPLLNDLNRKALARVYQHQRLVFQHPNNAIAYFALGLALDEAGLFAEAKQAFQQSYAMQPTAGAMLGANMHINPIPSGVDEIERTRANLAKVLEQSPPVSEQANPFTDAGFLPFYLSYHGLDNQALAQAFSAFFRKAYPMLQYTAPHCAKADAPKKVYRLGIASTFFSLHTIGKLYWGLIEHFPRERLEIVLFCFDEAQDAISKNLHKKVNKVVVLPRDFLRAREAIAQETLDALFYPDIGIDPKTYFLAHNRLAPMQCVSWGHPDTTGISTIDYFISSELLEPEGAAQQYTERLVKLSTLPAYYYKPAMQGERATRAYFGLPDNKRIYFCGQSSFKLHPEFDEVLAAILQQDDQAEILLLEGKHIHWTEVWLNRFQKQYPELAARVRFIPLMPQYHFMNLLTVVDAVLDTMHFGAGNGAYEAFALGVPMVTWRGEFMRGRVTAALYDKMGIDDLIARDKAHFVKLALRIANDKNWAKAVSERILKQSHAIFEDEAAPAELAEIFLQLLDTHGQEKNYPTNR